MRILKTKILFALASEVDFLRKGEGYGYKGYDYLYYRLSEFEKGSIRDASAKLNRGGEIDKLTKNNRVLFRLTSQGREKLLSQIRIYRGQKKTWDRRWRMVILEGVGDKSNLVKRRLERLGYKRVSRGVYVTPLSVSEETKKLFFDNKLAQLAQVIESRKLIVGDDSRLARRLWNLDVLGEEYERFVRGAERLLKLGRKNNMLLKQSKGGFKTVFDGWFTLLLKDPGIPKKLLPPDWQADRAREMFERLIELTKTAGI